MILTTIAVVAQASPAATASPAASPTDATVLAHARSWFDALQHGQLLDPSELDDRMKALMTPAIVTQGAKQLEPLGAYTGFDQVQTGTRNGDTFYVYKVTFKGAEALNFIYVVDGSGKISGLRLTPAD